LKKKNYYEHKKLSVPVMIIQETKKRFLKDLYFKLCCLMRRNREMFVLANDLD
jgi:hypothetical protein